MTFPTYPNLKIVILGNQSVGKTSLINCWLGKSFVPNNVATVGGAASTKVDQIDDIKYSFQMWDTAGAEKYRALSPLYTRDSMAALLVFDLTKQSSFDDLNYWVNSLSQQGQIPFVIAGNKEDLTEEHVVKLEDASAYAANVNSQFFAVSAKTGNNVDLLFKQLEFTAVQNYKNSSTADVSPAVKSIDSTTEKQGSCC
ncbi:Ras-related protein Rab-22A [Tritrichomonas foetus]|uniref:Ras-related protein Rab-22A n=1 Tax=Tritrichomonas foetus TaxID=1144522 RepID=A0A1J4K488_9EUKA|nr:Ras-related protein Rab-22A [Tritrichomonas foetus]|eukprot:OHT05778.1 Ras-related protein Rab-22A [Tritrichomonas foetus]